MSNVKLPMQKGMIDSHCHLLSMAEKKLNIDIELRFCEDSQMFAVMDIGLEPDDLSKRIIHKREGLKMLFSAGIYPSVLNSLKKESEITDLINILRKEIETSAVKPSVIGECGIDFFHHYGTPQLQRALLEAQIDLANQLHLPVVIHNREADRDILQILKAKPVDRGGIIHCFSSGKKEAFAFTDMGFYLSFSGNLTYKNSPEIQEALQKAPATSILAETDSPYLSPQPVRKYFNRPSYVSFVYEKMAILTNHHTADMVSQIKENFIRLFPELEG